MVVGCLRMQMDYDYHHVVDYAILFPMSFSCLPMAEYADVFTLMHGYHRNPRLHTGGCHSTLPIPDVADSVPPLLIVALCCTTNANPSD